MKNRSVIYINHYLKAKISDIKLINFWSLKKAKFHKESIFGIIDNEIQEIERVKQTLDLYKKELKRVQNLIILF